MNHLKMLVSTSHCTSQRRHRKVWELVLTSGGHSVVGRQIVAILWEEATSRVWVQTWGLRGKGITLRAGACFVL